MTQRVALAVVALVLASSTPTPIATGMAGLRRIAKAIVMQSVAKGKPTKQSSTGYGGVSSRATDGKLDGHFNHKSVTHTNNDHQAWWEVNLGRIYTIREIRVWNRTDCCGERLANFFVLVSQKPFLSTKLAGARRGAWSKHHPGRVGKYARIAVGKTGQYVRVQLAGKNFLSLAEVQVVGSPIAVPKPPPSVAHRVVPPTNLVAGLRNLARGRSTQQSSTAHGGVASRAADGNRDGKWASGSVSHTPATSQPWWQVDLGATYQIAEIRLWNRTDCCGERLADFDVLVSQRPFGKATLAVARKQGWSEQHRGRAGRSVRFRVNKPGRYVRIQLGGKNALQLAEVEVVGSNPAEARKIEAQSRAAATKAHDEAVSAARELALLLKWDPSGKPPAPARPSPAAPGK